MSILRNLYEFDIPKEDLVLIKTMYIRSILEYNSNVWFSSITEEEREDIERVQSVACKIILKEDYISYEQALHILNLQTLDDRRQILAKRFAQKCSKSEFFSNLFPKKANRNLRNPDEYKVKSASTGRLNNSSLPALQRLLNKTK